MTLVIDANIAFSAILNTYSKIDTNFIKKRKPMGLKEKIHALIESCDDETALEETYFFWRNLPREMIGGISCLRNNNN